MIIAHLLTRDEKMTSGRIAGILVGFAGVTVIMGAEIRVGSGIAMAATGKVTMASLILLPAWLLIYRPWSLPMPVLAAIMAVLAIASLSKSFAYALYFRVLSRAAATSASLVTMLIPSGGIIMGILVLDETVLPRHLVELALTIAGLRFTDERIRLTRRG